MVRHRSRKPGPNYGIAGSSPAPAAEFMFNIFKPKPKTVQDLSEVIEFLKKIESKVVAIEKDLEELKDKTKFHIQKVGLVRFNPFGDMGGEQSFSIALLDGKNDGLVITSFYSRDGNRVYAKPILNGQSKYHLSKEEKEAIAKALS